MVEFLRSCDDFDKRVNVLNGQLQGYKFGMDLLDALVGVRMILSPFLEVLKDRDPRSVPLSVLCNKIAKRTEKITLPELRDSVGRIEFVHAHLPEIQLWFTNLGSRGLSLESLLPCMS